MVGNELAHYRILAKLGSGGMGEVYLAEDTRLERKVALKVLPAGVSSDPKRLARLAREAKALAALNHPNIVTVFSVEQAEMKSAASGTAAGESIHFITMEQVEGRTLAETIPAKGLPLDRLLELAARLAEALAAAHEKGIVHRDLKPRNVMVTHDGRLKVLDFGLARNTAGAGTSASFETTARATESLTGDDGAVGTAPYMSPEQVRGEPLDHRSDIFALGVVLYQMATGSRPFAGATAADTTASILRDEPPPTDGSRPDLPDRLRRVIRRCLEKEPLSRYQSALDVRHELEDLGEASSRPTDSIGTSPRRAPAAPLLVGLVGILGLVAAWALRPDPAQLPSAPAPIRSIAVLPFSNLGGDEEQAYFVQGVQEALINDLSKIASLRVTSRTSTVRYQRTEKTAPQIAAELGVDALVEGSVLRAGDQVRITAQVIRAATDEPLWSGREDRKIGDVLVMLSEVAQSIVAEIEVVVTPQSRARLARARPVVPEAHEALMRGKHAFSFFNVRAAQQALEFFREAAQLDPEFAEAHAYLAMAHTMRGFLGNRPFEEIVPAAEAAVERALALDPDDSMAYTTTGWINYLYRWDFEAAERAYERAIQLNPSGAHAYHGLGDLLAWRGDVDRALEQVRITGRLDPLSEITVVPLVGHLAMAGRYDEALAKMAEAEERFPGVSSYWRFQVTWAMGREEESIEPLRRRLQRDDLLSTALDRGYERGGPVGAMKAIAEELEGRFDGRTPSPMTIAGYHARARELDRAFQWLNRAVTDRATNVARVSFQPDYANLRGDPRYAAVLERIRLEARPAP